MMAGKKQPFGGGPMSLPLPWPMLGTRHPTRDSAGLLPSGPEPGGGSRPGNGRGKPSGPNVFRLPTH